MMISRRFREILLIAGGAILFYLIGAAWLAHLARGAGTDAVAPAPVAVAGWSSGEVMALIALIVAAAHAIVEAARAVLHFTAPRTATTWDDVAAASLDALHERMTVVESLLPNSKPQTAKAPTLMLAVLVLGLAGASTTACGGSQGSRAQTVASLYTGLNAASASLRQYETDHAEAILVSVRTHATSAEAGAAALTALRAKIHPAEVARDSAYAAIDLANTLNDDPSLAGARTAIVNAITAIGEVTAGAKQP